MAPDGTLFLFVDEAGDLGFTPKSSKFFIIAYIMLDSPENARTTLRRLKRALRRKGQKLNEFKHSKDSPDVRRGVFDAISKIPINAGVVVIDKSFVKKDLRNKRMVLYNYLIADKIASALLSSGASKAVLILDRCMSKEARDHFNEYFVKKVFWKEVEANKSCKIIDIRHDYSYNEPNLQIADYFAGALFRKFEKGIEDEYMLIKHAIKYTEGWGVNW
ncbi:MAG: DUF3800 domain-containing protein [Candidatus Methanosuratincola verstraetei]|jgi:hypothetical protein